MDLRVLKNVIDLPIDTEGINCLSSDHTSRLIQDIILNFLLFGYQI
jgi:hypothetical protein